MINEKMFQLKFENGNEVPINLSALKAWLEYGLHDIKIRENDNQEWIIINLENEFKFHFDIK